MDKILPNTTQVPNVIFDAWLPRLKDVELRVLLIIIRQTLGWIEDYETGRRKEKDWISRGQLMHKTGRGHTSVSIAIEKLVNGGIIEAYDAGGRLLESPKARSGNKVLYRLNLNPLQKSLFPVDKPVRKVDRWVEPVQNSAGRKVDTTKETLNTKIAKAAKLPTNDLLREFNRLTITIRNTKPFFVRFKDGGLVKSALGHLSEGQIRLLFIWFLMEKREMQPTIGAALSRATIHSFLEASQKEYGFYNRLSQLHQLGPPESSSNLRLAEMRKSLSEMLSIK